MMAAALPVLFSILRAILGSPLLAGSLALVIGFGAGDLRGHRAERASGEAANLRAQIAEMQRESRVAATIVAAANARADAAETDAAATREKIDAYAKTLRPRPPCALGAADRRRLCDIAGAACPAGPARPAGRAAP
jgi:outer membrane murein-binding lipoprotein Lpp